MTTRWVELIGKKAFATVALNSKHKAFVIHIAALSVDLGDEMHPSRRAQIAHLKANKAATKVPSKYADFADVFLPKLAMELPEYGISNYATELVDN